MALGPAGHRDWGQGGILIWPGEGPGVGLQGRPSAEQTERLEKPPPGIRQTEGSPQYTWGQDPVLFGTVGIILLIPLPSQQLVCLEPSDNGSESEHWTEPSRCRALGRMLPLRFSDLTDETPIVSLPSWPRTAGRRATILDEQIGTPAFPLYR